MRRELHLPNLEGVSNAPDPTAAPSLYSAHAQQLISNQTENVNNSGSQTDDTRGTPMITQTSKTGSSRKNKNHQSPILSDSSQPTPSSALMQQKKARLFSPQSALPPQNTHIGEDLFSCQASEESVFDSSASHDLLSSASAV